MRSARDCLSQTYADLGDDELIELWLKGDLTELAFEVARAEFGRRGIDPPERPDPGPDDEPGGASDDVTFVTVARSLVPAELEVLRARLEAEDIPVLLADEGMNRMVSLYSVAIGGIRLMVPHSFADEAKRIIGYVRSGRFALRENDLPVEDNDLPAGKKEDR